MRFIFQLLILLVTGFHTFSQQARQYTFKHFTVTNGLASNSVNDVMQDNEGYIWIATISGLQRYDGNSFLTFTTRQGDPSAIPNSNINDLYKDRKGNLWITCDNNQFGIFDTKRFTYKKAEAPYDDASFFQSQRFFEMNSGELLLIKPNRSLLRYDERIGSFVDAGHFFPYPEHWHPNDIIWDSVRKKYWIGCDSGIVQYDPVTRHANYRDHNIDKDPIIAAFAEQRRPEAVRIDSNGNLFYIYWDPRMPMAYIFRYNRKLAKVEKTFLNIGYHEISNFLLQRNGRVWIYGMPFMAEWDIHNNTFNVLTNEYRNEQSLKFDHAVQAFEDREKNIWIATDNGAFLFNPDNQVFNTYSMVRPGARPVDAPVTAIAEIADGRIFAGCWGLGLFCFDQYFNPMPVPSAFGSKYTYMSIWDMAMNKQTGKLWMTQQAGVIDVYDPVANKLLSFKHEVFKGSTIRQVDDDTSGNLWFGTQSGLLVKWDLKKSGGDPLKGYEVIYHTTRILKVHYDYQGFIWLATLGSGLIKIDVKTKNVVHIFTTGGKPGERLFTNAPSDMSYFNDSTLLVSADCLNIVNTKTNQVSFYTANDGLPSNTIQSVQKDRSGIVWLGMSDGICRVNLRKRLISYYDRRDGIAYDKFAQAGVKQLHNDEMVFFTDHNFLVFDPKKMAERSLPPRPFITSFKLAGMPLSLDSLQGLNKIILKYNNTSVAVNFSALSFLQQRKVHYFYMLEGLDKDWIHTDHPVEALYNYLSPGDYVFKVKSETVDGITSPQTASIIITVRAPVWQTWWFYSLIALLVIGILYLLDKERMNKQKSLQQMRSQIRLNLREEVSTTLNNINVLSEIAKIKADKNVEQSKDFIDQISEKSRYMIEAMEDMLWSIDPQNDSMKKTLLRVKEVTEGLRSSYNVDIDLIVDYRVQELALDMKLRYEIFFFYKEAMNFIVQNISCDQIFVNLNKIKSKLLVEILCECSHPEGFKEKFKSAMAKRLKTLPAVMDVVADSKSFAVVAHIGLR